jgi:hypothetical protein
MKIDINKNYRTVSAKWPVTIVSTEGPYPGFPVVGYAHSPSTSVPLLCHWSEVGGYPANTHLDLIEVREPREWNVRVALSGNNQYNQHELIAEQRDGMIAPHEGCRWEVIRVREIID